LGDELELDPFDLVVTLLPRPLTHSWRPNPKPSAVRLATPEITLTAYVAQHTRADHEPRRSAGQRPRPRSYDGTYVRESHVFPTDEFGTLTDRADLTTRVAQLLNSLVVRPSAGVVLAAELSSAHRVQEGNPGTVGARDSARWRDTGYLAIRVPGTFALSETTLTNERQAITRWLAGHLLHGIRGMPDY
jgi:hypothetical protein